MNRRYHLEQESVRRFEGQKLPTSFLRVRLFVHRKMCAPNEEANQYVMYMHQPAKGPSSLCCAVLLARQLHKLWFLLRNYLATYIYYVFTVLNNTALPNQQYSANFDLESKASETHPQWQPLTHLSILMLMQLV